jgi:hypothetical protein
MFYEVATQVSALGGSEKSCFLWLLSLQQQRK